MSLGTLRIYSWPLSNMGSGVLASHAIRNPCGTSDSPENLAADSLLLSRGLTDEINSRFKHRNCMWHDLHTVFLQYSWLEKRKHSWGNHKEEKITFIELCYIYGGKYPVEVDPHSSNPCCPRANRIVCRLLDSHHSVHWNEIISFYRIFENFKKRKSSLF